MNYTHEHGDRLGVQRVASDAANKQAYSRPHLLPFTPDEIHRDTPLCGVPKRSLRTRLIRSS